MTDIDLREYLVDSFQFITFVIELENRLDRELPDDFLLYDNLASINGFSNMIDNMVQDECECIEYSL